MKVIQGKMYRFFFKKEVDMKRVLRSSPWMFRNSWLILEKWERKMKIEEMNFNKGQFLKARTRINITNPIKKGVNIGSSMDDITWVDFKYEKLPTIFYFCGTIGHDEESCEKAEEKEEGANWKSKELGAWIRVDTMGYKVVEAYEISQTQKPTQPKGKGETSNKQRDETQQHQKKSQEAKFEQQSELKKTNPMSIKEVKQIEETREQRKVKDSTGKADQKLEESQEEARGKNMQNKEGNRKHEEKVPMDMKDELSQAKRQQTIILSAEVAKQPCRVK
ncbi:hypothetical protein PIB30_053040 [Stylosanthes scabra]|uniref:Zinc knuckle CX2CX4HX4C domain-containing protein n=1 Tax=Stylosanthes scabra TaxID=79078 RepID=A0ABU6SJ39_9FABA|nr:hypothetical protein [Stylosanthes scabra]